MVKEKLMSAEFLYKQPFFYNNELAYRCELGQGSNRVYMRRAKTRAFQIFDILFPQKVDALFFHSYHCDYDTSSADSESIDYKIIRQWEEARLVFSLRMQKQYIRRKVRLSLAEPDEDILCVNRIICDAPSRSDCKKQIDRQLRNGKYPLLHFVNYDLNCIFSVYDHRGCDIVFFDKENYLKMYNKLRPYFLEHDVLLMEERVQQANR